MSEFYLLMIPIGLVLLIIMTKTAGIVRQISPFAYPNARIMAKQGKIISNGTFGELAESRSLEEIVNMLKETEYVDYLNKFVGEGYKVTDIERALNNHLAAVYDEVYHITPDSVNPIFEVLLKRWDIENIIRTLRCLDAKKDPNDYLIGIGTFTDSQREQMSKSKSVDEVVMSLTPEFEHVLNNVQDEELVVIENELLSYYYESLWKFLEHSRDDNIQLLKEYYGMIIDITNILAALRLNSMEEIGDIPGNFLPVTYSVPLEDLKGIASSEEIGVVLSILARTRYAKVFEDNMTEFEKQKNLAIIEQALQDMVVQKGKDISILNPLGVGPIIGFLAQKQSEVRKLKAIIIGIYEGIEPEKIKRYIGV
ncbi:MAG TPA: ATP synthase A1 subunit C [Candidatus Methanofastidiosa archaeon]|nr:ATP synthase A1 subunit C [Candidatus Methanofastidiosa archaeon]